MAVADFQSYIRWALQEDIGPGDYTTRASIDAHASGTAALIIKQAGIMAGITVVQTLFEIFDPALKLEIFIQDGSPISPGDRAFILRGKAQSILQCERLALNFLQRMSGIATITQEYVKKISDTGVKILDTRKTTPNFRIFEKEAVRIGGGFNHRMGLYDMIMIKDNHIDFCGGAVKAIRKTTDYLKQHHLKLKIEVEARTLQEVEEILSARGIHRILLDNMPPDVVTKAVSLINHKIETEASGGITLENIRSYAETGVDYISVGALTHRIHSLDMSLKAEI